MAFYPRGLERFANRPVPIQKMKSGISASMINAGIAPVIPATATGA
jgi:hypothetical protein